MKRYISYLYYLVLEQSGHSSGLFSTSFPCVCHQAEPPGPSALVCSAWAYQCWPVPTLGAGALVGAAEASYHVDNNMKHFKH